MDSLTQATLGAVVGELVLGRKLGGWGAIAGAFFGSLPDADVFFSDLFDQVDRVYWHRGISHSILMMIVATLVLSPLLSWICKRFKRDLSVRRAMVFMFLAWSTHVVIDCFTTYGTSLFEPFSDARAWWNVLFIIDLLFTLPMLLGLLVGLTLWRRRENRSLPTWIGLGLSCLYVSFSFTLKTFHITPQFEKAFAEHGGRVVATSPMPLNTVLWRGLGETNEHFLIGLYSPFDTDGEIQLQKVAKNKALLADFRESREFKALDWFSRGVWSAEKSSNGRVRLIDRRFSEFRTEDPDGTVRYSPVFAWELWKDGEQVRFQSVRLQNRRANIGEQLAALWQRVKGDETGWN